jgi:hypothetical protein
MDDTAMDDTAMDGAAVDDTALDDTVAVAAGELLPTLFLLLPSVLAELA